jgi:hypothetical protein
MEDAQQTTPGLKNLTPEETARLRAVLAEHAPDLLERLGVKKPPKSEPTEPENDPSVRASLLHQLSSVQKAFLLRRQSEDGDMDNRELRELLKIPDRECQKRLAALLIADEPSVVLEDIENYLERIFNFSISKNISALFAPSVLAVRDLVETGFSADALLRRLLEMAGDSPFRMGPNPVPLTVFRICRQVYDLGNPQPAEATQFMLFFEIFHLADFVANFPWTGKRPRFAESPLAEAIAADPDGGLGLPDFRPFLDWASGRTVRADFSKDNAFLLDQLPLIWALGLQHRVRPFSEAQLADLFGGMEGIERFQRYHTAACEGQKAVLRTLLPFIEATVDALYPRTLADTVRIPLDTNSFETFVCVIRSMSPSKNAPRTPLQVRYRKTVQEKIVGACSQVLKKRCQAARIRTGRMPGPDADWEAWKKWLIPVEQQLEALCASTAPLESPLEEISR